ncbi:hypothetical protein J6590_043029 [Homalodisca vitripennis]|nr:hypothetical protein J6590_043029 [Homalodisca vitripennis]
MFVLSETARLHLTQIKGKGQVMIKECCQMLEKMLTRLRRRATMLATFSAHKFVRIRYVVQSEYYIVISKICGTHYFFRNGSSNRWVPLILKTISNGLIRSTTFPGNKEPQIMNPMILTYYPNP